MSEASAYGKGDRPRVVDWERYRQEWDRIFSRTRKRTHPIERQIHYTKKNNHTKEQS
jgi:hypothetical protein